jgi:type I restriction enzyme M protein
MNAQRIVQKLWSFCNTLRDDGLSYSDYVEQLTYLLFLKMADERTKPPFLTLAPMPTNASWTGLLSKSGDGLLAHYESTLRRLGSRGDLFGAIFRKAQSKFSNPAKFQRLVRELIDREQWSCYDTDIKGEAYEGLLERSASEGKAGAGQYFTPRPLVRAIVEVMRPEAGCTICDPACGTGGFLIAAHEFIREKSTLSKAQLNHLNNKALHGVELVESVARLCVMNIVLHGIGGETSPVLVADALQAPTTKYDIVLTNPPFGKKSSVTITNEAGYNEKDSLTLARRDFWARTSNKQLNFLQHVFTILKVDGRAAIVVPDNVLFESGAGESVRRELLNRADVHTLLRLPTGIFYAQGVRANVLFFDRRKENHAPNTKMLWIYDLRSDMHFTLKERPLRREDLNAFVHEYRASDRSKRKETSRFRAFPYDALVSRDNVALNISWMESKDTRPASASADLATMASEIADDLQTAAKRLRVVASSLS